MYHRQLFRITHVASSFTGTRALAKLKIIAPTLLLAAGLCAGCATRYAIKLSNGDVITAKGRPHLNADKNTWLYTDASGQPSQLPASRVSQIAPQSMANDDDNKSTSQFLPVIKH